MSPVPAPELLEAPRRRARWGVAFLGSAAVLWFGGYFLGGGPGLLSPLAMAQTLFAAVLGVLGVVQLWRAALGARTLAIVTAALVTAAVGCLAAHALLGGRGELLLAGGFGLVVAGVCGAIVESSAPRAPDVATVRVTRPVGIPIALTTLALVALLALGAVDLLVWGPLAQTEGLQLNEIYAGLSEWDRSYGLFQIVLWLAFWSAAVAVFVVVAAIAGRRRALARRTIYTVALGLAAAIVFFQFWAGFSLGMSIADTLPPYRGGISRFGYLYALGGKLALIGVIFLTIAPVRTVDLLGRFSNPRPAVKSLIRRVFTGSRAKAPRAPHALRRDSRGPVVEDSRKSQTRLSPAKRAALAADYAAGTPVRQLSEKYRVHRGTVFELARRAGLSTRRLGLHGQDRTHAASLYASGMTLVEVAARMSVGDDAVRSAVLAEGGHVRPRGRRPRALLGPRPFE